MAPTLRIHHDLSVCQVGQSALLLLAEEPPDGGLDALLLGLFVQRVLAAGDAAEGAGLGLQRGHDPEHAEETGLSRVTTIGLSVNSFRVVPGTLFSKNDVEILKSFVHKRKCLQEICVTKWKKKMNIVFILLRFVNAVKHKLWNLMYVLTQVWRTFFNKLVLKETKRKANSC